MYRGLFIISITVFLLACGKKGNLLPQPNSTSTVVQPQSQPHSSQ
jgi:hypothetical protein